MKNFKTSVIAPVLAVSLLAMGVTACSNSEKTDAGTPEAAESTSVDTQGDTMGTTETETTTTTTDATTGADTTATDPARYR